MKIAAKLIAIISTIAVILLGLYTYGIDLLVVGYASVFILLGTIYIINSIMSESKKNEITKIIVVCFLSLVTFSLYFLISKIFLVGLYYDSKSLFSNVKIFHFMHLFVAIVTIVMAKAIKKIFHE